MQSGPMVPWVLCILILLPSMLAAIYLTLPGIEILKKQPPWLHDPWIQCKERATERHHHNYAGIMLCCESMKITNSKLTTD